MAIFIPTTCPICSADTHSTVSQRKDGTPKGWIKTKCLECGFEKGLVTKEEVLKRMEKVVDKQGNKQIKGHGESNLESGTTIRSRSN